MYGQIHLCIRSLVVANFGDEKWKKILEHSGMDPVDDFMTFDHYDDARTIGLVVSVKEVLEVPLEVVLELFGEYFFTYCFKNGYDKMLKTLGSDFKSFIQNLDSLHALLAFSYKDIDAPSFRVEEKGEDDMILHYYSSRQGLHHIVVGLCRSVGREMFQQKVSLEVIDSSEVRLKGDSVVHHVAFNVTSETIIDDKTVTSKKQTPINNSSQNSCFAVEPLISPKHFCEIFPYHVIFDRNLVIKQCGVSILKSCDVTRRLDQLFRLTNPEIPLTFDNIKRFINANYLVENLNAVDMHPMKLRGQMIILPETQDILFIGSPRLASLDEMEEKNMFLSDIPLYDVTRELMLLNQQRLAEVEISKQLDETTSELKRTALALEAEKKKTEFLLYQMLPKKVALSLKDGKRVDAEKFDECTILFSDVVTFTKIASAVTPIQIVSMLNNLYTRFDELTETHNVYKVETIGDAYMIVGGVPDITKTHAERVASFSLDMVDSARHVMSPATGKPLQIRVGFHSGPVVAGVVGDKMPRYCLFGDTVNTSSRMESHGMPGKIHLSSSAYQYLHKLSKFAFESRGTIEVKGKGQMQTYWLCGHSDGTKWNLEYDDNGDVIETSKSQMQGVADATQSGKTRERNHTLSVEAKNAVNHDLSSNANTKICQIL